MSACRSFEREFERCYVVNLSSEVSTRCGKLAPKYSLKALDLIHLASAVLLYERFGKHLGFAGADRQLLRAAEAEGLDAVDVESIAVTTATSR